MRRLGRRLSLLAATTALAVVTVFASSPPADAAVYNCDTSRYLDWNMASARCQGGFGYFRVAATCNSARWPYTITIYGPWEYKRSAGFTAYSWVSGDDYGCHITRAWMQTV